MALDNVRRNDNPNYGFDALLNDYGDMIAKGIIDPTKTAAS